MKVDDVIDVIVSNPDKVGNLSKEDLEECLENVTSILNKEKALVELSSDILFVGDTHGDFETTKSIINRYFDLDHLIFLGDYIDREPTLWGSIYNLTYLLILKSKYPEKIVLLKGNHECNYAIPCYPYEFEREILSRFHSFTLHSKYVEAFSSMPLMILANNIFAAHGGILKGADLKQLRNIDKNDLQAIESIVWSDPVNSPISRGAGDPFDEVDLIKFLDKIRARVFIRGHDYNTLGTSIYQDRCLTIFSSCRYKEMGNGGILVARSNKAISNINDILLENFSTGEWIKYKIASRS